MPIDSFDEHLKVASASPLEQRTVGSLRLFRARRAAGFFRTPPLRGVSIRMNRSRRHGTKTVDYDARRFSSPLDRHYSVAPANRFGTCELSSDIDFLAMEFPPDAFEEHLGDRDDLGRLHDAFHRDELVMHLVERLWRESAEGITRLEADGFSMALAALLVRAARADFRRPHQPGALCDRQLRRLSDYVDDHLGDDLSVLDLGRATGCSTTRITSALRAAAGSSPWQFVLLRRIERAKTLLTSGQRTISEIAMECGFSSSQHFATAFKKQVGATPGAYRRQWRL
jgi:AraC family transcriptional regulator